MNSLESRYCKNSFSMQLLQRVFFIGFYIFLPTICYSENSPLTIKQFIQRAPQTGTFHIQGVVTNTYSCPPCPAGMMCKPSIPNNMTLSEFQTSPDNPPTPENSLVIFAKHPEMISIGKHYEVTIDIGSKGPHDLHLITFQER